jgi:hypothetical protein
LIESNPSSKPAMIFPALIAGLEEALSVTEARIPRLYKVFPLAFDALPLRSIRGACMQQQQQQPNTASVARSALTALSLLSLAAHDRENSSAPNATRRRACSAAAAVENAPSWHS